MGNWFTYMFSTTGNREDHVVASRVSGSALSAVKKSPKRAKEISRMVKKIVKTYKDDLAKLADN